MNRVERRSCPRVEFEKRVLVYANARTLACQTNDLSMSGMLVFPPTRARPGLALQVRIDLPGLTESLDVEGVLVREAVVGRRYAWGLKFTRLQRRASTLLNMFVKHKLRIKEIRESSETAAAASPDAQPDAEGPRQGGADGRSISTSGNRRCTQDSRRLPHYKPGLSARAATTVQPSGAQQHGPSDHWRTADRDVTRRADRWEDDTTDELPLDGRSGQGSKSSGWSG